MLAAEITAVAAGLVGVLWVLVSAVRTVVIPRPERVWLTRVIFRLSRSLVVGLASTVAPARRHRMLGSFAPIVLVALPGVWAAGLVISFAMVFWGLDVRPFSEALVFSGSSLTTLGFSVVDGVGLRLIAIVEAFLGLGIVALMISFLPSIYGTFSRREIATGKLAVRAGEPPDPAQFLVRMHRIGRLDDLAELWAAWEEWFVELGETHTSFPALVYFRSAQPSRSWVTAAETALDTAALALATEIGPRNGHAQTMIRSGFLALCSIAEFFDIEVDHAPAPDDPVSITRQQFDLLLDQLRAEGVEPGCDGDTAWLAFRGWRVNYDRALTGLAELVTDVPSHWNLRF